MTYPPSVLGGAQGRLLPLSIPLRFFLPAILFQIVAWALIAVDPDQATTFVGGPGPTLAAVHALTLGVLVMVAIGASLQILPVVTGRDLLALWPCRLTFWLYVPGTLILVAGFHSVDLATMTGGALLVTGGLALYTLVTADVLRRTKGFRLLVAYNAAALLALVALAGLGLALALDFEHGFLMDHLGVAIVHMILGVFGFMGLLAMGYSLILVPMFALAQAPSERLGWTVLILAVAAIVVAVIGALWAGSVALILAAVLGLLAAGLHIGVLVQVLRRGMRKRLGLSFILVRAAWGALAFTLLLSVAAAAGVLGDPGPALFGFIALFGWLLTFLTGILQRIIPFLAALHAGKEGRTPPRLSELTVETPLRIHAGCHLAAVALISVGLLLEAAMAVLIGALVGVVGAAAFAWFAVDVLRRMGFSWLRVPAEQPGSDK